MSKVVDLRLNFPLTAQKIAENMEFYVLNKEGEGIANYRRIFGPQLAASLGTSLEELEIKSEELSKEQFTEFLVELAQNIVITPAEFEKQLDEVGIEWGLVDLPEDEESAAYLSQLSDRLYGITLYDPFGGAKAVKDLENAIREKEVKAVYASPYRWGIKANDPRFYPCYAQAIELDIPVFIYTAMNYRTDYPMDVGRPLYLDQVAIDFPKLRIIARCGGWPWVPELIGVARRHQNVYIDTSSHRPKYLAVLGSGFEMLMQFGNTLLQDRIVFASGVGDLGLPIGQIVNEMKALPLKEDVKEKWLYKNAQQLFRMN
jgi:predicted TIM-barrel fold metal-dependent hydrolase